MEEETKAIVKMFADSKSFINNMMKTQSVRVAKSNEVSEYMRQEGNMYYERSSHNMKLHEMILQKYCVSIAVALNGSEKQALGYANRSAFLMHLSKFKEAIQDIDRAIKITKLNDSKFKWMCRKVKCLVTINSGKEADKALEETKAYFDNSLNKKSLKDLIQETEKLVKNSKIKVASEKNQDNEPQVDKKTNDFSSIDAGYRPPFKKHLIAVQDFQPGEVVFVEKPYTSTLNLNRAHFYCNHCLIICWNMIPCDECSWCMYCSEECKLESWKKYHDIECPAFGNCMRNDIKKYDDFILLSLRLLVSECKAAGSIPNLQDLVLTALKQNYENLLGNFNSNEKNLENKGLKSILNLHSSVETKMEKLFADISIRIVIALAKHTEFFNHKYNNNEFEVLSQNKNVIFIGALILKLLKIAYICGVQIKNNCLYLENDSFHFHPDLLGRGYCIPVISSLINHDCDPNVSKCFTKNNQMIVFAIKPIKKNHQLFFSYVNNFTLEAKDLREYNLDFTCYCKACKKKWQPLIYLAREYYMTNRKSFVRKLFKNPLEVELYKKHEPFMESILDKVDNFTYTEETVKELSVSVVTAIQKLKQPSIITYLLIEILRIAFSRVYGDDVDVPNSC